MTTGNSRGNDIKTHDGFLFHDGSRLKMING